MKNNFWDEVKKFHKDLLSDGYTYTQNFYYKGDIKISIAAHYIKNKERTIEGLKTIKEFKKALKEING